MNSSQINFYLMKEDIQKISDYINALGLLIIAEPMPEETLNLVSSLTTHLEKKEKVHRYLIFRKEDNNRIKSRYIEAQNYYTINETDSPIIEFIPSEIIDHKLYRGRIYYNKKSYASNGKLVDKDFDFLKIAGRFI